MSISLQAEADLLQKINSGFTNEFWERYKLLVKKRQAENILPEELEELIRMTDQLEEKNVERISCLSELARIRNTSLPALMKELGLSPVSLD